MIRPRWRQACACGIKNCCSGEEARTDEGLGPAEAAHLTLAVRTVIRAAATVPAKSVAS